MPKSRHRRKGSTRPRVRHEQVKHPGCVACNDPDWSEERELDRIRAAIARVGWYAVGVLGEREHPPYIYTVGLGLVDHPELVMVGMTPESAYAELGDLARMVLRGEALDDVDELETSCGCRYRFVPVRDGAIDLNVAETFDGYAGAIQCVWSADDRFPGDPSYPQVAVRPPLLGRAWWV